MPSKVLINTRPSENLLGLLKKECELQILDTEPPDDSEFQAFQGLFTYGHYKVSGAFMDLMPELKVISNFGVGVDHIDIRAARERSIPVGNTPGILDGATADMAFALLLAAARNIVFGDRFARSPEFTHYDPSDHHGYEVHSTKLGIIGLGNIGYQIAKRALGFDMKITYHNRTRNLKAESELGAEYVSIENLLSESDHIVLSVPLTQETRGMIGSQELKQMKSSAILVNIARGGVMDHAALFEALKNRWIASAATDVTEPEPLPRDHPLLTLENFIIVPHLGSATFQTRSKMARLSVKNLMAGLTGKKLPSSVF